MFASVTELDDLRCWSIDALVSEYARLDALEAQVRAHRLLVLAVLDEREVGGRGEGALDTAGWVAAESRVLAATARTDVLAARALSAAPEVADVGAEGRLSRDQLTPAAQLAPTNPGGEWAENALTLSPQQPGSRGPQAQRGLPHRRRAAPCTFEGVVASRRRGGTAADVR